MQSRHFKTALVFFPEDGLNDITKFSAVGAYNQLLKRPSQHDDSFFYFIRIYVFLLKIVKNTKHN